MKVNVEGLMKINKAEANDDISKIENNPFSLLFPTIEIVHAYVESWRSIIEGEKGIASNISLEQSNSSMAVPMAKSMTDQENEREFEKSDHMEIYCVICVGSTGAGKSTLIKKMTKQDIKVGSGPQSVTKKIKKFEEKSSFVTTVIKKTGKLVGMSSKPKLVWIDTQGFEDDSNEQDNVVFRKIFQFLKDNNISHIQTIIWNITPQERMTATLQRQANLINQFGNENVNIWDNVLIVCKKMRDTSLAAQGAIEAANLVQCKNGQLARPPPRYTGFTTVDDEQVQKNIKKYKAMHIGTCERSNDRTEDHPPNPSHDTVFPIPSHILNKTDFCTICGIGEIKFEDCKSVSSCKAKYETLKDLLYVWEDDVIRTCVTLLRKEMIVFKIQYKIQKCKSCGEKNDYRLMSDMCHTDYEEVHGEWLPYHTDSGEKIHTGREPPFHKVEGKASITGTTFSCCGKNEFNWQLKGGKAGCKRVWSCCKKEKDSEGCSQVEFYKCCQGERPEGHTCDPIKKHYSITEFSYPGHFINPWNWNIGGFWTTKYKTLCHHDPDSPGCMDFYPCCSRFQDDDEGGCKLNQSSGCKIRCTWCSMDPRTNKKGCRKVCKQCKRFWGDSEGCTKLPEGKTHDVQDLFEESQSSF